jgi:hypothetical protein
VIYLYPASFHYLPGVIVVLRYYRMTSGACAYCLHRSLMVARRTGHAQSEELNCDQSVRLSQRGICLLSLKALSYNHFQQRTPNDSVPTLVLMF